MATPRKKDKNKGGRPTLYKPEYAKQLLEFFDVPATAQVTDEEGIPMTNAAGNPVMAVGEFPTKAGFACEIGVDRDTLNEWSNATLEDGETKKHPEFSVAYKQAELFQERILIQNALTGRYNAAFSIFTAKNVIGWRDKHDVNLNTDFAGFLKSLEDSSE
jgi:DNA-binding XRE family transcriptional regulator